MTQAIQSVKILGAGLAALASAFLPRGGQGIALASYLLVQGEPRNINSPVKLSLFYPSETVEEVAKNPTRAYLHGHLWDLAHKVLAATAFYFTFGYSLVPGSLKVTVWARMFFSLVPVVLKLTHWSLDLVSIKGRCRSEIIESCRDTAYKLGKCIEMLYWGMLGVVPYVATRQFDSFVKIGPLLVPALVIFALWESFDSSPPSRLNELQSSSKTIENGNWNPENIKAIAKDLAVKLNPEEQIHVHRGILAQLEKKLEIEIYPQWTENTFASPAQQELEIRKIQGREGIYEDISISLEGRLFPDYFQYEMQQIRLAMMLLCLNLRRLDRDSAKYDESTMQKIQKFLYLQALYYPRQSIAVNENGAERRILQCYDGWKSQNPSTNLTTSDQEQAKEAIAGDPFFDPLRRMLPHIAAIGLQKFIPELQDLFHVLENLLLSKNHQRAPYVFRTDKTLYSEVESAATKTLEEIIQICQQS